MHPGNPCQVCGGCQEWQGARAPPLSILVIWPPLGGGGHFWLVWPPILAQKDTSLLAAELDEARQRIQQHALDFDALVEYTFSGAQIRNRIPVSFSYLSGSGLVTIRGICLTAHIEPPHTLFCTAQSSKLCLQHIDHMERCA